MKIPVSIVVEGNIKTQNFAGALYRAYSIDNAPALVKHLLSLAILEDDYTAMLDLRRLIKDIE